MAMGEEEGEGGGGGGGGGSHPNCNATILVIRRRSLLSQRQVEPVALCSKHLKGR